MIRLPQDQETPLTSLSVPFGTALYLYSRSVDSINAGDRWAGLTLLPL